MRCLDGCGFVSRPVVTALYGLAGWTTALSEPVDLGTEWHFEWVCELWRQTNTLSESVDLDDRPVL